MLDSLLKDVLRTTPAHLKKCQDMGIRTVSDLLEYYPRKAENVDIESRIEAIQVGQKNTLQGQLLNIYQDKSPRGKMKLTKATLVLDQATSISVVWFRAPYILRNLRAESTVYLSGRVVRNYGEIQMQNPEVHMDKSIHVGGFRPIYPESPPITSKWLREKIHSVIDLVDQFPEYLPESVRKTHKLMGKFEAVKCIHFSPTIEKWEEARRRLAFEEIFCIQAKVIAARNKRKAQQQSPFQIPMNAEKVKEYLAQLPFVLTVAQRKVLLEILKDLEREFPAHRLVQGDVGSGKTIVAILAALQAIDGGYQAAMLAPTEILAQQHFASAIKSPFFQSFELASNEKSLFDGPDNSEGKRPVIACLTGSTPTKQKEKIKEALRCGQIDFLVGTHAIIMPDTVFKNLAVSIIDEQHRFGVAQRAILGENNSHVIAMTATPIPRTLALAVYGDQDLSVIDQKPAGRKDIITRIVADVETEKLFYKFIEDQIGKGRQIFWVCPLVENSDKIEAESVENTYEKVSQIFPNRRVAVLHGKMRASDKAQIMEDFKNHKADILVATSVIEVGVDIPNSTVMVIENSERFGLSQLHQFRGRIGRNDLQSYCFLKIGKPDHKNSKRLKAMEKSNDGFYLSEVDLKLRGAGEVYGTKQSGVPDLKCADFGDTVLISAAQQAVEELLATDPLLEANVDLREYIEKHVILG